MIVSLQILLFGYEFPETICLLANNEFFIHSSPKKLDYLNNVAAASKGSSVHVRLLPREKGDATVPQNRAALEMMIAAVDAAGKKLGTFSGDNLEGPVVQSWISEVDTAPGFSREDATKGAEAFLAVKDSESLNDMKEAGKLVYRSFKKVLIAKMEGVIDSEKKKTHEQLSEEISSVCENRAGLEKAGVEISPKDFENFEVAIPPVVQSGGVYNIALTTPGVVSTNKTLTYDVIIMSMGMRYNHMRAFCARTYFIDPTPKMRKIYQAIESAQTALISMLVPGAVIKDVCTEVRDKLISAGIPLESKLGKNFGSGIGARISDRYLALNHRNETVITAGMTFNVSVCLTDIPLEDKFSAEKAAVNNLKSYAVVLADTVIVSASGPPQIVTEKCSRDLKQVSYEFSYEDEEEEEEEDEDDDDDDDDDRKKKKKSKSSSSRGVDYDPGAGRDARGRSARLAEKQKEIDPDAQAKREAHQLELIQKKQDVSRKRLAGGGEEKDENDEDDINNAPAIVGYRSTSDYPKGTRSNAIIVDKQRDCVLLPLLGTLVPFHISTIKSVTKSEEGAKSLLRINFHSTGASLGKDVAPSMAAAVNNNPDAVFIRTLNFLSRDHRNFADADLKIKNMLKMHRDQRKEEKETAGLIEQPKVILRKDNVPKVVDIHMWPPITRGRTQGTLSAHINGLVFLSSKGERLEIAYGNIKTGVFQPCEGEHIVLIHFHLRHSILIGKKKYKDVQFYTEVVEQNLRLDNTGKGNDYDQDELGEEERERQLKLRLNKAYKFFVQKIEDIVREDSAAARNFRSFEVPPRDLLFYGVWAKEMTTILLGASAIVSVVDKPPLVISIDDIELVHFERVIHGGKSFDMVIVFKSGVVDKGLDEFVRISQIEFRYIDTIKDWLDNLAEVIYTESTMSLVWKSLIAEEVRDPYFWLDSDASGDPKHIGMAEILSPYGETALDDEEEESDESSAYESEDDDDDDDDDDLSLVDEDEDDSDDSDVSLVDEDEDEEEEDWDELEKKAAEADKKRRRDDDDDSDDDKKGKRKGAAPTKRK